MLSNLGNSLHDVATRIVAGESWRNQISMLINREVRNPFPLVCWALLTLATTAAIAQQRNAATEATPREFVFRSISVEGSNLVFRATIPLGIEQLVLETLPTLEESWSQALVEMGSLGYPPREHPTK